MEHLTDLKIFTFFYLQNMLSFPNVHETRRWLRWAQQIWSVVLFLSTFNFNIWYVYLLQQLQQHISLAQCQYIFRELQLMLSNASCNSSQRLSFECAIDLAGLFSNSPQICSMGLRTPHHFSMFQQIPSIAGSSGNSSFYGYSTNSTETS